MCRVPKAVSGHGKSNRQDNAGCCHNALNLLAMKEVAKDTNSHLEGIFQTPKGEKGHLTEKQPESRTMSKHT